MEFEANGFEMQAGYEVKEKNHSKGVTRYIVNETGKIIAKRCSVGKLRD